VVFQERVETLGDFALGILVGCTVLDEAYLVREFLTVGESFLS